MAPVPLVCLALPWSLLMQPIAHQPIPVPTLLFQLPLPLHPTAHALTLVPTLLLQPPCLLLRLVHHPALVPTLLLQLHPFTPAVCVGSPTTLHLLPDLHAHPSQAPLLVFHFPPLVGFHPQVVLLALVVPVDLVDPVVPLLCRLL